MRLTAERLIDFIAELVGSPRDEIALDLPLFSSGLLDSFNMVELVTFVEAESGIKFGILDLNFDNLDTVDRILGYVARTASR